MVFMLEGIATTVWTKPATIAAAGTFCLWGASGCKNPTSCAKDLRDFLCGPQELAGISDKFSDGKWKEELEEDEDEEERAISRVGVLPRYAPVALGVIGLVDLAMGGVVLHSMSIPIDMPLKEWVIGGILLSMPVSSLVYNTAKEVGFKHAFLLEAGMTVAGFAWLSAGMLWVSKSTAYASAPLLFWSVYILCVSSWSVIGTSILGLILTTVVAILFGNKSHAAIA